MVIEMATTAIEIVNPGIVTSSVGEELVVGVVDVVVGVVLVSEISVSEVSVVLVSDGGTYGAGILTTTDSMFDMYR